MNDSNLELNRAGILANIDHYESLVTKSKDAWEVHLAQLQYWLEKLEQTK